MNKLIIFACFMSISMIGISQTVESADKKPDRIKLVKSGESNAVDKEPVKKLTPVKELENCEKTLNALDKKEAYIRNNPDELKLANENGWFVKADKTREDMNKRVIALKLELKK